MINMAIRRPVTVAMTYLVIAALGVFAWRNVPIELYPDTSLPQLTVSARWPGASAEVVEAFLTSPLESVIQQVRGVETVTSTSTESSASIQVAFNVDTDMDFARLELSERLSSLESAISACMPICRPTVSPYRPRDLQDQGQPLLRYTATGPYTLQVMREYLLDELQPELLRVEGVDRIDVLGGRDRILQIQLDEYKIQSLGIRPQVVQQAITRLEDIRQLGAVTDEAGLMRPIALRRKVASLDDVMDQPVILEPNRVIRVRDIGHAYESLAEATSHHRINGMPAVSVNIYKGARVNAVETADLVKARLTELAPTFPQNLRLILNERSDQSNEIRRQLNDLRTRAIVAAVVVLLVLLLFLRSIRASTIVFATIGFAVLITINLLYFGGLTLNVFTLMGLAMGFGLVVDNAIVVLENTYRLRRRGVPPVEAAQRGAREVVLPILAATGTTVVVVIPFVYLQGDLRILYVPLAFVVGLSLIASLFVAFTFIPALAARLLAAVQMGTSLTWRSEQEDRSKAGSDPATPGPDADAPAGGATAAASPSRLARLRGRITRALDSVERQVATQRAATDASVAAERAAIGVPGGAGAATPADRTPAAAPRGRPGRLRRLLTLPAPVKRLPARAWALLALLIVRLRHSHMPVPVPELAGQPWYVRLYATMIGFSLRHAWITVLLAVGALGGSYYLFDTYVTRNSLFGFGGEQRTQISITIQPPRGESIDAVDALARFFEDRLAVMPEIEEFQTNVSATRGTIVIDFPDSLQYSMAPLAIEEELIQYSLTFGGTDIRVRGIGPAFMYGGGGVSSPNYNVEILGYNYEKVRDIAEDLGRRLATQTRVREVDTNSGGRYTSPLERRTEIAVAIDADRLANYDLSKSDVASFVNSAVQSDVSNTRMRIGGEDVQLQVKLSGFQKMDIQELEQTLLPTRTGEAIRVGDVTEIKQRPVMNNIVRANQQYQRYVSYEFRGPAKLGDNIRDQKIAEITLPPGYTIKGSREYTFRDEDKAQIYHVLGISILLIFMVTAALFESMKQPLCVLLTVPMALIGVFLLFFYIGASFTREAYIGTIMMAGIVVNNAILLIDHVNQLRWHHGVDMSHALVRGAIDRVRPILMTSLTTICGMLPLVLFSETVNSNIWNALGYTLIGGLASSTILVLTVTPALYMLFERHAALVGAVVGAVSGFLLGVYFELPIDISTAVGFAAGAGFTYGWRRLTGADRPRKAAAPAAA